jgi:hypothetical protein
MRRGIPHSWPWALRRFIAKHVPNSLGRIPYALALQAARSSKVGLKSSPEIWARHSYVLAGFVPGLSDIDLTIWFGTSPSSQDKKLLLQRLKRLKHVLPLLGEINAFVDESARRWVDLANPLELERDPQLLEKLGSRKRIPTREEKAAFLLHAVESDLNLLKFDSATRTGKWRSHLQSVGLGDDLPLTLEVLAQETAHAFFPSALSASVSKSLLSYWSKLCEGTPFYEIDFDEVLFGIFPHRAIHTNRSRAQRLHSSLEPIAAAQLQWEIWGLLSQAIPSQSYSSEGRQNILRHLKILADFLDEYRFESFDSGRVRAGLVEVTKNFCGEL